MAKTNLILGFPDFLGLNKVISSMTVDENLFNMYTESITVLSILEILEGRQARLSRDLKELTIQLRR